MTRKIPLYTTLLLALASLLMLSACKPGDTTGYAVTATSMARAATQLHLTYDAVSGVIAAQMHHYSEADQSRLHTVHTSLQALQDGVARFDGGVGSAVISADELWQLYQQARLAYAEAHAIIAPRLGEMSAPERSALEQWDQQAQRLDTAVNSLMKTPDGRDISGTVEQAIGLASSAVRLAITTGLL